MRIDTTSPAAARPEPGSPVTLIQALRTATEAVKADTLLVRRALARRDTEGAWSAFARLRRRLAAHLAWELADLPELLPAADVLDWPCGTRTLREWHELLMETLADVGYALTEPCADGSHALRTADHFAALLHALVEDYESDVECGVYRELDRDVERHDAEPARRRVLEAWRQRTTAAVA